MPHRRRILFVSRELPLKAGRGVERRAAQHLEALLTQGDVTIILPNYVKDRGEDVAALRELGGAEVIVRDEITRPDESYLHHYASGNRLQWIVRGLRRRPYFDDRASRADAARYRGRLHGKFDLAFAFRLSSAIWFDSVFGRPPKVRKIVDLDDIESVSFEAGNIPAAFNTRLGKIVAHHHLAMLRRSERKVAATWDTVSLCSDLDAARFEHLRGRKAAVVPNSIAFDHWTPEQDDTRLNILFVGTFPYPPNHEGVLWFATEVWPKLIATQPDGFSLTLAGFNPTEDIMALDGVDGIRVLDSPADLDPVYAAAHVVIVPIFSGSGTRIKAIEAMAKMRAVVSTSTGCEGLGLVDGKQFIAAEDAEGFVTALSTLAKDPARRSRLAQAAYAHARALFSQEEANRRISRLVSGHDA